MKNNPNDKIYTPDHIAREIVSEFIGTMTGTICEPAKGDGALMKYLPDHTEWFEIDEGKDFYDCKKTYHTVITNPPF